jgi:WD40 repeat protein
VRFLSSLLPLSPVCVLDGAFVSHHFCSLSLFSFIVSRCVCMWCVVVSTGSLGRRSFRLAYPRTRSSGARTGNVGCSSTHAIVLWFSCTPTRCQTLSHVSIAGAGHTDRVWHAEFSRDGVLLASCSGDRTVRIWQGPVSGVTTESDQWHCVAVLEDTHSVWQDGCGEE